MASETKTVKIAAIADLHIQRTDKDKWKDYFSEISSQADVLLACGDLTNTGDEQEARVLAEELKACSIPVIAVLGNHDHERGHPEAILEILQNKEVHILDGDAIVIEGVGFAGVKGFGGGFDQFKLTPFGEKAIKVFVDETMKEVHHLDNALAQLERDYSFIPKIVLLHYAPIEETVRGEPGQIYPFLGSSRLADPLIKRKVVAAFHGHAHAGKLTGMASGVKIFNVAHEVLKKEGYRLPFFLYEI